jgi:TldD protein
MKLGRQFGPKGLNIVDDGTLTERFGGYRYDEEGVPSSKTYLMQDGILCGRLHSRETAYKMSESPTGNARALNYKFEPIVRMSCTSIEPSNTPLKEIISDTRSGIFALSACGGMGGPNEFVLTPAYGFKIKNGKIIGMIRDLKLQGNIFETLRNIDGISTEYGWEDNNCSKGGQNNLPVSWGGPYIRIKSLLVGGKG